MSGQLRVMQGLLSRNSRFWPPRSVESSGGKLINQWPGEGLTLTQITSGMSDAARLIIQNPQRQSIGTCGTLNCPLNIILEFMTDFEWGNR